LGRLLGMGMDSEEAAEQMAGESVEGLDAVMAIGPAVEQLISRGMLPPNALPLLRQIYAVALKGRPVEPIFDQFFQQRFLNLHRKD
jgi:glycerol-3-phosphate dehydrogenase